MLYVLTSYYSLSSFLSLDALDPNAYAAFQVSQDLKDVVERVITRGSGGGAKPGLSKSLSIRVSLMTPVKPMLVRVIISHVAMPLSHVIIDCFYTGGSMSFSSYGDEKMSQWNVCRDQV